MIQDQKISNECKLVSKSNFEQSQLLMNPFKLQVQGQQHGQNSLHLSNVTSVYNQNLSYQQIVDFFKHYEPSSSLINLKQLNVSQRLKLKKYKQAVYYGQFKQKKRDGLGIMMYNNGQIYEGQWKNDLRHGEGYQKYQNGCYYSGHYEYGKMQGVGIYHWVNGQIYEGEWLNNKKHGTGMWKNQKGDNYLGQWFEGEANGTGIFTQAAGNRYEGNFLNFMKHGQGTQKFSSGDLYKGKYANGKFQGFGEYYWKNGSYYKGNFKNGCRSGHGVWKSQKGLSDKYQGQFLQNKKEGYGIYTWECGNLYKGNYKNNMRHGYGQLFWQDGSFYRGLWENDMQNGQGQLFNGEQKLIKGSFKNGELLVQKEQQSEQQQNKREGTFKKPNEFKHDQDHPVTRSNIRDKDTRQLRSRLRQKYDKIINNTPLQLLSDFQAIQPIQSGSNNHYQDQNYQKYKNNLYKDSNDYQNGYDNRKINKNAAMIIKRKLPIDIQKRETQEAQRVIYKESQAKLIKMNQKPKGMKYFTLQLNSRTRQKQVQSLHLKNNTISTHYNNINNPNIDKGLYRNNKNNQEYYNRFNRQGNYLNSYYNSNQLDKRNEILDNNNQKYKRKLQIIPHSAFQVHRLHKNRGIKSRNQHLVTVDHEKNFAFRYGQGSKDLQKTRNRYYSRLN